MIPGTMNLPVGPMIGQGLGLAVPINGATRQIIATLMRDGRVRRAYLGIAGGTRQLAPRVVHAIGREKGIVVSSVVVGSPATANRPADRHRCTFRKRHP